MLMLWSSYSPSARAAGYELTSLSLVEVRKNVSDLLFEKPKY